VRKIRMTRNSGDFPWQSRSRGARLAAMLAAAGAALALAGAGASAATASDIARTLYVSPSGSPGGADTSCATAAYTTIGSALAAARPGDEVFVCAGTYDEQVTISTSGITLKGSGPGTVIDPTTSSPVTVRDSDSLSPVVPIVDVTPGTRRVRISGLAIDGSGLTGGFSWPGCGDQFAGVLFQAASGSVDRTVVQNVELPANLFGCQDGNAILIEGAPSGTPNQPTGTARVSIGMNTVTGYDKNGITCNDPGITCGIWRNAVTGVVTGSIAQNGVQIGFGARGWVRGNQISADDYTGATNPTEPQADYAAGILLYGARGDTHVTRNTLTNDQIAIEVVHSRSTLRGNAISETGGGIAGSIGVFAAPCDYYCSDFGLSGGGEHLVMTGNAISFPGGPLAGSYGVWAGDAAASATGVVRVHIAGNHIAGAENDVVLGPTATGTVITG